MAAAERSEIRKPRDPLRISVTSACEILDLAPSAVRGLIHDGTFTTIAPHGRGRGKRLYLFPDEVRVYATEGREGVLTYRRQQGRLDAGPKR